MPPSPVLVKIYHIKLHKNDKKRVCFSMIERFSETYLASWHKSRRRKPLLIRGARQVGKSTLVRNFAQKKRISLCEINLERNLFLDEVFKTLDTSLILKELEAVTGKSITPDNSLLFLDEIQATPNALQALRYFFEDQPQLPVIAAGSLLEFTLADHSFSMPVGRIDYYHLHPVSFNEYIAALEPALLQYLAELTPEGIPAAAHNKLLNRQREYFFVGGMPEAVSAYMESGSLQEVIPVHRSIVNTYQDDFAKYARKNDLALLQKLFSSIPRALGKKIKYSNISSEIRSKKIKEAIALLVKARCCHYVHHAHCSGIPLNADINEKIFKLIFMDIALASHICGLDWLAVSSYGEQQLINEGGLAEQFIGQHLANLSRGADSPCLHYWLREGKTANAEVDYIISRGDWIVPIEVKSGKSGSLKSLQQFVRNKGVQLAVRFDLNPPSLQNVSHCVRTEKGAEEVTFNLLSLPLYAVEELPRLIDDLRRK